VRAPTASQINAAAEDYLANLDTVAPADRAEARRLEQERGWADAIRHFVKLGMLTPKGMEEARKILAAGEDWLEGFRAAPLPPADALDVWGESLEE
jgi:hypothetical protein